MKTPGRVSVVIPVYRRAAELAAALRSLGAEADLIHEIVVVDDASPEPVRLDPPPALAGKVRLVRLEVNSGSSAARQAGVDAATGEFIAFLDSDDAWLPGKLAAQLPLLAEGGPLLAVACGWQVVDLDRGRMTTRIPLAAAGPALFASGCWFAPGATVVVPRAAFGIVGPMDGKMRRLEDLDWFLRFGLAGGRLVVAPVIGAVVRRAARSNSPDVEAASRLIEARFEALPGVDSTTRRRLAAYLDLERAFARFTQGRRVLAASLLARSYLKAPRLGFPHLRRWWRTGPPVIARAEVEALLGLEAKAGAAPLPADPA
jgi:glycosyltransferase involved in cell wall biosynthesis